MAKRCQLTGKSPMFGHNVSHSNRKTNRRFDPNLQKTTLFSEALRRKVSLRVSTRALRTVSRKGGLDAFLLDTADAKLTEEGLRLKRRVKRALAGSSRPVAASIARTVTLRAGTLKAPPMPSPLVASSVTDTPPLSVV